MTRVLATLVVLLVGACASGESARQCANAATDCPASTTACASPTCGDDGACASANAAKDMPCDDSGGKVCDGNGQCVECTDAAADCPAPASECETSTCDAGMCGMAPVAASTVTPSGQITGDCKSVVCDGAGSTMVINANDPPNDGNDCTTDTCVNGVATPVAVTAGMTCATQGGKVCGSGTKVGTCVACLTNAQCTVAPNTVCDTISDHFICVTPSCTDQLKDGMETDTDCGGPTCATCANTKMCSARTDCTSGYCAGTTCAACTADANCLATSYCDVPTGKCLPDKTDGGACTLDSQCTNGHCIDGVCCNTTCTSTCMACSATKKGSGLSGVCGNIVSNSDPDNECAGTYSCSGNANCQSCSDAAINGSEQCDDGGASSGDGCSSTCACEASRLKTLTGQNVAIPDNAYNGTVATMGCVTVTMPVVTGCPLTVTSVKVLVGVSHTWVGDLVIKLVSPAGTTVTLMSRPGSTETVDNNTSTGGVGNSANLATSNPITFQQGASTSAEALGNGLLTDDTVCLTDGICTYAPNNGIATAGDLTTFNGQAIAGNWKLCVGDAAGGDTGTIDRVTLTIGN